MKKKRWNTTTWSFCHWNQ